MVFLLVATQRVLGHFLPCLAEVPPLEQWGANLLTGGATVGFKI